LVTEAYSKWRELGAAEKSPLGQAGILREQIAAIGAEPSVHVVHVALPHRPWSLSRSGISSSFVPEPNEDEDSPDYEFASQLEFQLHSMQVGATDVLIGDLVEHLQSLPTWEETLLVVTSDHGTNLTPPDIGRMRPTEANREEVYRVPLFIKAPGSTRGAIHDESVSTIDVLPTVVDLLGGDVDWDFDGHSLVDGSTATLEPPVSADVDAVLAIAARRGEQFPYGDDWLGLAAVGPNGDLVGSDVAELEVGPASELHIRLDQADQFDAVPTADGRAPFVLTGTVTGPRPAQSDLVVAINGRVAGILGGPRPAGGDVAVSGYVADLYRRGANEVVVYEVGRDGTEVTLHEVDQT
jgi:Sulfatase